jgi:hypothetical protein
MLITFAPVEFDECGPNNRQNTARSQAYRTNSTDGQFSLSVAGASNDVCSGKCAGSSMDHSDYVVFARSRFAKGGENWEEFSS